MEEEERLRQTILAEEREKMRIQREKEEQEEAEAKKIADIQAGNRR